MSDVVNSTFFVSCQNYQPIACSLTCVAIVTTFATLFFTHVIPLNSPIASIGAGSAFASLNLIPIGYWIYQMCCKKDVQKPLMNMPNTTPTMPLSQSKVKEAKFNWEGIYFSIDKIKSLRNNETWETACVTNCGLYVDLSYYQKQGVSLNTLVKAIEALILSLTHHYGSCLIFSITLENCDGYTEIENDQSKYKQEFFNFWKELANFEKITKIIGLEEQYWKGIHLDTIEYQLDRSVVTKRFVAVAVSEKEESRVARQIWDVFVANQDKHAPIRGCHSKKCPVQCLLGFKKITPAIVNN